MAKRSVKKEEEHFFDILKTGSMMLYHFNKLEGAKKLDILPEYIGDIEYVNYLYNSKMFTCFANKIEEIKLTDNQLKTLDNYKSYLAQFLEDAKKIGVDVNFAEFNQELFKHHKAASDIAAHKESKENINKFIQETDKFIENHPNAKLPSAYSVSVWMDALKNFNQGIKLLFEERPDLLDKDNSFSNSLGASIILDSGLSLIHYNEGAQNVGATSETDNMETLL